MAVKRYAARVPADHLYERDGQTFVPTELTAGPWSPEAQHGGPPSALLARAIESHEVGGEVPATGLHVARLTVEIMRPVPLAPLSVSTRTLRPGRKVQLVEATMTAGDTELCRAVGLRIRTAEIDLPSFVATPPQAPPLPEGGDAVQAPADDDQWTAFHNQAVEMRYAVGAFERMGPATVWIRLRVPVVAGEETTPLQRVAAVADFGNGVSATLPFDSYLFINPDLTIYLHRPAVGEWVCLDAVSYPEPNGVGLAESALSDSTGRIGRSLQSLLVDRR